MTRTPYDTFLSDQTLATARDAATDPHTVPVAITAPNGEQCSWCECPDGPDSPHNQRGYRCPGCPQPAAAVVSVHARPVLRYDFPACDRHQTDIIASVVRTVGGRL
ncbi:hypothetical protein [Streptomyces rapamycinicus]|uniref:Uncharacterized protein n=2 Tax=Streptomyces rapamycinicus TaxID=1226757 RepID=A0A0A0NP55_STRRN|nr:hypothetical protein [Streptomyces rapamycinicus]AGP56160.1 hypothetical protein M271_23230 [Streptomyces rapamycinicus NRRL 5491]MBB4783766.1 hypothetical protein [Streptomyces rapamycinicus]RLV80763.1 hypothetical protein D3C57_120300 [Streptomyces rapamycinicus NRRL 5491]UTO64123.1 DUF4680 domain-containing protein [Streptomyces rapamycinicus]UTP32078.1 DUF4680 domain-containing protein [Streptomyces rapamycinicus NRRL 5491]